jgi:hypothetical protein
MTTRRAQDDNRAAIIDRDPIASKLRAMDFLRSGLVLGITVGSIAGCRSGDKTSTSAGGARSGGSSAGSAAHVVPWFPRAAPLLLAPGRTPDRSLIAWADTTVVDPEGGLTDSSATFVHLDGSVEKGRVAITQSAEGCTEAAIDPAPATPWGVGFIGESPTPLRVDSIRGMSPKDSTALTRTAYRLASTVPNGAGSRFGGLAFVLVDLWRVTLPSGKMAVVASLRRQINQEDSPMQERTFIVAESDSLSSDGYSLAYSERSSGLEEVVESHELLAAFSFAPATAVDFLVAHDFGDETSYAILERTAPGKWTMRWTSQRFSC